MNIINTAIILDGSNDSSFLNNKLPKSLIDLNPRNLLQRHIKQIENAGIQNIIISSHNYTEAFDKFIEEYQDKFQSINIYSTKERIPLGSGGAIKNTMLNSNIEEALVINGNSYINIDINEFISFHYKNKFENSICVTKSYNGKPHYLIDLNNDTVKAILINLKNSQDLFINAGLYILNSEIFNLTHLQHFSLSKEIFPSLCDGTFGAFQTSEKMYSLDTEESYKDTLSHLE